MSIFFYDELTEKKFWLSWNAYLVTCFAKSWNQERFNFPVKVYTRNNIKENTIYFYIWIIFLNYFTDLLNDKQTIFLKFKSTN